jgi:transposase
MRYSAACSRHSDLDGVHNALTTRWSNGKNESQISPLKTLKRAMYGSAGAELLQARMPPHWIELLHREPGRTSMRKALLRNSG